MSFLDDLNSSKTGDQHALSSSVSNPEHQGSGRSRTTDFLVTTKFANASESLVRRTWEDFHWIQERLVHERVGIIVPVLPNKKPVNAKKRFDDEFVKERQEALHWFIQRVVKHPELVDAPSLLPFFTANPTDWVAAKEAAKMIADTDVAASNHSSVNDTGGEEAHTVIISAAEPLVPQKKKGILGQWMAAKRDQLALRKKNLILEESPVESKRFEDMQSYADHLETCIRILVEDCKALMESKRSQSEKFKTVGAAFTQLWGEHELSNTSSSTMYQALGDCWANLCKQKEQQGSFGTSRLVSPLEELVLDVVALKEAIAKRKRVVYEYTKKVQEGRKLQEQMDKLRNFADLNHASDQYFALEREIRASDLDVEERKKFKELITDRLSRDIERFRVDWHERMRQVMENYHKEQILFLSEQSKLWEGTLPMLVRVEDGRAALPTGAKKAVEHELTISYTTSGASASFTDGSADKNGFSPNADFLPPADSPVPMMEPVSSSLPKSTSFDSVKLDEHFLMDAPPPVAAPPPPPNDNKAPHQVSV